MKFVGASPDWSMENVPAYFTSLDIYAHARACSNMHSIAQAHHGFGVIEAYSIAER